MIAANIDVLVDDADWRVGVTGVDRALIVQGPRVEVWRWFIKSEADLEVCRHNAHGHVVNAPLWNGSVDNGGREILTARLVCNRS